MSEVTAPQPPATGAEAVAALADRWCQVVATSLDLPRPVGPISLALHRRPGVARVQGTTIHLFQGLTGEPDTAQLAHELVHLVAGPSPSRFLGEGLAVHIAACVDLAEPCWPCYGAHPDDWVAALLERRVPEAVSRLMTTAESVRLGKPDLTAGEFLLGWRLYLVAGSFTGHLFRTLERELFWSGYRRGACWESQARLADLEQRWQASVTSAAAGAHDRLSGALRQAGQQMDLLPWDATPAPARPADGESATDAAS